MPDIQHSGDRRPIAARQWRLSQRIADALARGGASPNGISVAGAMFGVIGGVALAATAHWPEGTWILWLTAAAMMQLRLQCNLYDGMVAIATGRASPVGELYNDVPDRISDSAFFIGAGYATGGKVALGYAAALAAMFTAYVRALGKAGGAKQEFCGPMAKQQRMALLTVTSVYCALAPKSWQPLWGENAAFGMPAIVLAVIVAGSLLTAARRLWRIAQQLREPHP